MPARMTVMPSEERMGRTVQRLTVSASAATRKTRTDHGYPQARYGRVTSGSFLRKEKNEIAVSAKKIHTAKTNKEYSSSKVPVNASSTAREPTKNNAPLGLQNLGSSRFANWKKTPSFAMA